jgi:hypothetical protein
VKPILAGLLMAAMLLPARQLTLLPALPVAAVAGVVYLGALFLLGTFSNEELHLMRDGLGFVSFYFRRSPHQVENQG